MRILGIRTTVIAFGKTQVIDRIEQIGFTYAIWTTNTYDTGGEAETSFNVVFKLD